MTSSDLAPGGPGQLPDDVSDFSPVDDSSSSTSLIDAGFDAFPVAMGIIAVLFILVLGFIIFIWVRNYRSVKASGMDPFTLESTVATRIAKSQLLAEQKSVEQKLAELDDLRARGIITNEEFQQARHDTLRE